MSSATAEARTIYHVSPLRLWLPTGFFIALSVVLLACAALSPADADSQRAFALTGLFLLGCTGLLFLMLRFARLELSEHGIRLYQIGYTLEATWDDVAGLYEAAGAEGIVLNRPMQGRGASVLRHFRNAGVGVRFYHDDQVPLLGQRRFIPIEAFAYWLKHGRLRDDLARRAPSITHRDSVELPPRARH